MPGYRIDISTSEARANVEAIRKSLADLAQQNRLTTNELAALNARLAERDAAAGGAKAIDAYRKSVEDAARAAGAIEKEIRALGDGCGRLVGSAGGSGVVHYGTGALAVTFAAAPANGATVSAAYARRFGGVLDEETDTAETASGLVVVHGSVRADVLKIGPTAQTVPTAGCGRFFHPVARKPWNRSLSRDRKDGGPQGRCACEA